jgi:hypothetical protein
MPTIVDTAGLDRLKARFDKLANPNPVPLLITWMQILDDDNRKGVLAGLDKHGTPMIPVTYRPKEAGVKLTVEQRLGQSARKGRGRFAAFGSSSEGLFNNLSSSSYRKLDGPPLAPRRQFSRVITNYIQRFGRLSTTAWEVVGYWDQVLSRQGIRFLHWHFDGTTKLPSRDLRGLRQWGVDRARETGRNWMIDQIRSDPNG